MTGTALQYQIKYSARKKVTIRVDRDRSVIVLAPFNNDTQIINRIVEQKKFWIYEKINHPQKQRESIVKKEYISGEGFLYRGKTYRLDVQHIDENRLLFKSKFILPKSLQPQGRDLFIKWYRRQAKRKIREKVSLYASQLGVKYKKLMISEMQYRWGSCTKKNTLNFNWNLIKAPDFVSDYIVVHELAHLKINNHSKAFWNLVFVVVPQYKKAIEWLKVNGTLLENDF